MGRSTDLDRPAIQASLQACELELEQALSRYEQLGLLEKALQAYWQVEVHLEELGLPSDHPDYPRQQAALAQCFLRQSSILRQFGQFEKAAALSERELAAARASQDPLTLARSLMSYGAATIVHSDLARGQAFLEEARQLFSSDPADEFQQGLGWYWILRADLDNARITSGGPERALAAATRAQEILQPLGNWSGVGRAWAARAIAAETLGDLIAVGQARQAQAEAETRHCSEMDQR